MRVSSSQRRILAVGDIHGCAEELEELLKKIRPQKDDVVVFLGDYIDRGPDSRRVVDLVLDLQNKCEVVALKGNHEALFLDFLERPESPGAGVFVLNGGSATLANYSNPDGSFSLPDAHLNFFRTLKLCYETDTHYFVHAGVPNIPLAQIVPEQHEMQLLWSRYPFLNSEFQWEKVVVHGHTPMPDVEVRPNRINIDTACVYSGLLTALELPKVKFYHVEKGAQTQAVPYPAEGPESARRSTRFSGRLPVMARAQGGTAREYETLNFNQFGLLLRDLETYDNLLKSGDKIEGTIGSGGISPVKFQGSVIRVEARTGVIVYGVTIDSLSNDRA